MECFKCTGGMCPEGLNPMLVNEIIKGEYISSGLADNPCEDAMKADSIHRVLASIQVSAVDYRRITRPEEKRKARYVFFPGCNVYFQPEKILSALDILDAIGDDWAFLPGLDYCCGDSLFFAGDITGAGRRAEPLVAARTGADYLIVSNYVQRVAAAMRIERDDCFKRYLHWRNLDRIVDDAGDRILESPFKKQRIIEVLKSVFVN